MKPTPLRNALLSIVCVPVFLACVAHSAAAAPKLTAPQEEDFEPITFGDNEYEYTAPFFPGSEYD